MKKERYFRTIQNDGEDDYLDDGYDKEEDGQVILKTSESSYRNPVVW